LQKAIRPVTVALKQHLPHFPMVVSKFARIVSCVSASEGLLFFSQTPLKKYGLRPSAYIIYYRISLNPENAQGTL